MRRSLTVILVAALVVVSGCAGLGGDGSTDAPEPTPTETPTPDSGDGGATPTATPESTDSEATPTATPDSGDGGATPTATPAPTATPTPAPTATPDDSGTATPPSTSGSVTPDPSLASVSDMGTLPPGVRDDGKVTNASALTGAMFRFEGDAVEYQQTLVNSTGPNIEYTLKNDTQRSLYRLGSSELGGSVTYYLGESVTARNNETAGHVTYATGQTNLRTEAQFTAFLLLPTTQYISLAEWQATGVETVDGEQRLVLRSNAINESRATQTTVNGELTGVEGRLSVTSDGIVREGSIIFTAQQDGQTARAGVNLTTRTGSGITVDSPDWLSQAPQVEGTAAENNRLLELQHTGGEAIPAGTTLTVNSGLVPVGNVTVEQEVQPGDSFYVYKTGQGTAQTPEVVVGQQPSLPDNATAFSGQAVVAKPTGAARFQAAIDIGSSGSTFSLGVGESVVGIAP